MKMHNIMQSNYRVQLSLFPSCFNVCICVDAYDHFSFLFKNVYVDVSGIYTPGRV